MISKMSTAILCQQQDVIQTLFWKSTAVKFEHLGRSKVHLEFKIVTKLNM